MLKFTWLWSLLLLLSLRSERSLPAFQERVHFAFSLTIHYSLPDFSLHGFKCFFQRVSPSVTRGRTSILLLLLSQRQCLGLLAHLSFQTTHFGFFAFQSSNSVHFLSEEYKVFRFQLLELTT